MTKYLLIGLLIAGAAATASAQTFTAPVNQPRLPRQQHVAPIARRGVTGVVPRAIRNRNPIQMLNPRAPARYGTSQESVMIDPVTGKWNGIRLFSFVF